MRHPRPQILFFNPVRHALRKYQELASVAQVEVISSTNRLEFFKDLEKKYKDITAIYSKFDAELIQKLPASLKFICHNGAGYDAIDIQACTARGITVTNAPDPVTNATADLTLFLLLGAIRQLNPSLGSLRKGAFKTGVDFGHDPQGKILGIIGMGRIGRAVKRRAEPFGLKTIYHNRNQLTEAEAAGAPYVSFHELLTKSDIISLHVPLNSQTRYMIGADEIAKMKDSVVIVNTARGAIIDEAAMAAALDSGKIASVGLDVYENEPEINKTLMGNERALLIPHLGTHTTETLAAMESLAMENARRGCFGESLLTVVTEQQEGKSL
ncbi:D-isomer specific 2-hydroxyacid dehydrogenase [Tricladium varicosporioides]|nr:D-isomer specific 2-hydroxyacid dehydrogenase [Hymenoscyphus varicosporioides]